MTTTIFCARLSASATGSYEHGDAPAVLGGGQGVLGTPWNPPFRRKRQIHQHARTQPAGLGASRWEEIPVGLRFDDRCDRVRAVTASKHFFLVKASKRQQAKAQMSVRLSTALPGIAVLPFDDLSPDQDSAYIGDAMAEELIGALSRLPELKVGRPAPPPLLSGVRAPTSVPWDRSST